MKAFPFMGMRWIGFLVTAIVFTITTVSLVTQGLNLGLDFTGGVLVEAAQPEAFDVADVRNRVTDAGFEDISVTTTDAGKTALIRVPVDTTGADVEGVTRLITEALGDGVDIRKTDAVGPKVSGELFRDGVIAAVLAVVAIGIYVWFRFESRFGWAAFITTFHDVYAVVGLFSLTRMTFDLTVVAGVLTVAGYSINDTVVVFDRIRETLKKYKKLPLSQIIDRSITATLSRTLITSVATGLAALAMMFLGGPVLFGFAASIVFGIVIGTYSSIFVAAPLLMYLPGRIPGSKAALADDAAPAAS
ncbi:MAG: protein translocase subunit SecF [Alphaproteobacteria bacterium]|nr:protein translocase subunit SecF [Alphaproteobacteria bacterium]